MTPTDNTAFADSQDIRAVLSGLEAAAEQSDPRARQQAAVLAFARRASACPALWVLRHDAVALTTRILHADLGGTAELADDGRSVQIKVAATDEHGRLTDPVTHTASLNATASIVAHALSTAQPVVTSNLPAEDRFADAFLFKLGVVGALCIPMYHGIQFAGALAVFTKTKREFTRDDVQFGETISHLLMSSIARLQAEQQLRQQRRFASTVSDTLDAPVLTLDVEGRLLEVNRAGEQLAGSTAAAVREQPFWQVFAVPEESEAVRRILSRSKGEQGTRQFETSVLAQDGEQRRIAWSLQAMRDQEERIRFLVLTGIDQTRQLEAETALRHVNEAAENALKALMELDSPETAHYQAQEFLVRAIRGREADEPAAPEDDQPPPAPSDDVRASLELRSSPRLAFRYRQRIAPMLGDRVPRREEFFEVECRDVSAGGMAFLMDQPPEFHKLVVELGRPPGASQLTAKVVRLQPLEQDGREKYLVGCQFTGRVHL